MHAPEGNPPDSADGRPDIGDIPSRPKSPAVIRFLGCEAEMAGLSTDYFTAGRTDDCDLRLPKELGGDPSIVLRFSRGAEGWRISPAENQPVFVNQEQVRGLTPLRSGDVIRFSPGAAGMQFNIVHQNATPLANLVARYAPRMLGEQPGAAAVRQPGDDPPADGAAPLRYEAGGQFAAATRPPAGTPPNPAEEPARKIDPAILVAGAILLGGSILGAAVLLVAPGVPADPAAPPAADAAPADAPPAETPPPDLQVDPPPIRPTTPPTDLQTPAGAPVVPPNEAPLPAEPAGPPPPRPPSTQPANTQPASTEPKPTETPDPEALIEDPFG